ncbi:MAG TPA: TIR domain-containing protein [Burkholderiales bacterium]|nr:TIR domain-containing protein [Burkholderiales bacterium]
MTTIFISYRRDDAAAYAGRLYDGLRERYGEDHVFMDVDRIQPGENFATVIERSVQNADVMLAVIGETWLTVTNESRQRRLDDPEDFVRLELKAALDKGRRVIPVLVGGASMPAEHALPPVLRRLAGVQAVTMSNERWDYDAERLTRSIDTGGKSASRRKWFWGVAGLALVAGMLALFIAVPHASRLFSRTVTLRAAPAVVSADEARAMVAQRDFFHARWNAAGAAAPLELERQVLGTDVVVKETHYQLLWQQRASPQPLDHNGAQHYVQQLNALRFAGYSDWRLPTLEEAMALMGSGSAEDCRLHRLFERSGQITRTADTTDGGKDWIVYFCDGVAEQEVPGFNAQARAVRSLR